MTRGRKISPSETLVGAKFVKLLEEGMPVVAIAKMNRITKAAVYKGITKYRESVVREG